MQYFITNKPDVHTAEQFAPWQAFVKQQVMGALLNDDLTMFVNELRSESWLLSEAHVRFQARLIEVALLGWTGTESTRDCGPFIAALLDLDPALLRCHVPPHMQIIATAFTYAKRHLVPLLLRICPMPDDLPHAAGNGDLACVQRWFDASGKPALGDLLNHYPVNHAHYRGDFKTWFGRDPGVQEVIDTALAWAVLNRRFEVADFLLGHGADINTNWSSHEPASILHELVWHKDYVAMQFLIDRGIDMTIRDFRWDSTAQGWAAVAAKDEVMAQWLAEAEQRREQRT